MGKQERSENDPVMAGLLEKAERFSTVGKSASNTGPATASSAATAGGRLANKLVDLPSSTVGWKNKWKAAAAAAVSTASSTAKQEDVVPQKWHQTVESVVLSASWRRFLSRLRCMKNG